MHEACRKNAGVYIGVTIPLETAQLEADGSFESTGTVNIYIRRLGVFKTYRLRFKRMTRGI